MPAFHKGCRARKTDTNVVQKKRFCKFLLNISNDSFLFSIFCFQFSTIIAIFALRKNHFLPKKINTKWQKSTLVEW